MKQPKALIVISRYNEDISWVHDYTENYLIYNKGIPLNDPHEITCKNIGGNQRDIFQYVVDHYDDLPELVAFCQAIPWDHVDRDHFDKLIYNEEFTPLEWQGETPHNDWEMRDKDFGFCETNNSWYIGFAGDQSAPCEYYSFDHFMNKYFSNYNHVDWIRFSPGSQYILTKEIMLYYPKSFWERLMHELDKFNPTEGHIIERALWMIFQCRLELR
jgi:hypothetical protein